MFSSTLSFTKRALHYLDTPKLVLFYSTYLFAIILASSFILFLKFKSQTSVKGKQAPLPPGPTPWPIIGNLPEKWRNKPFFRYIHALMKELNTEIACIRLGNVHVIPVTSPEIAREFLKKYDSIFASRPLTMTTDHSSNGYLSMVVVPMGDQWKKMRKVVTTHIINPAKLRWQINKRTEEADNLVRFIYNQCKSTENGSLIGSIVDVRLVTRHYCGNVIRKMMFNKRYFGEGKKDGGPGLEEEEHVESLLTILEHAYAFDVADYIPSLRAFDLEGHEKIVTEAMRIINKYQDPVVDERVQQWRDGKRQEPEDLLDAFILAKDENGKPALSTEEIKAQVTELVLATVDNPSNAIEWAMAEMINQPQILQKAIKEIDMVVGKERLVQESDVSSLNYIKACAREAYRLHPVAPFNLPHVSNKDTIIAGYFIPKGSHVILSRMGLGRNPRVWEDPFRFDPARHLKDGDVELNESELRFISFSTGRRGCMGVALGSVITVMLLARLVQGFTWSVPPNEKKIDLSEAHCDLFMAKPLHAYAVPRLPAEVYPA